MMVQIISQRYMLSGIAVSKQGGRPENQDDCGWVDTPLGFLLVVCDGMGGGPGGKTASRIVKEEFLTTIQNCSPQASRVEAIKKAVSIANEALYLRMEKEPTLKGMGSTLVAVLINEQSAIVTHLGDSRFYSVRGKRILFRTADHSLVGEMVRNKAMSEEQARQSPQSNVIMRALGNTSNHVPEINEISFRKGDRFILCSDGVWGIMPHEQITERFTSIQDVASLATNLSAEIDQIGFSHGGNHDNHTMAIIELKMNSKLTNKMDKIKNILLSIITVLLLISVFLYVKQLNNGKEEIRSLKITLDEKEAEIKTLQNEKKLFEDIKNDDNRESYTKLAELCIERDSLKANIDSLKNQLDSIKKVLELTVSKQKSKTAMKSSKSNKGKKNKNRKK